MPVTPANDVAPNVKMFTREEIKNQTDDQSLPPNDEPMKDAVTDLDVSKPARAFVFNKEQQKSPGEGRGFDLMSVEPVCTGEKVQHGLQLELGNKSILSGDNNNNNGIAMETDPKSSVSKSRFIAKLFEGEDKKVDCTMEEKATPSAQ
ncbi:hypothetical protein Rs2_13750 [Raphanus sativus]|nr:hypothetical protein Rs2_13750 [Raphanus sativus]